MRVRVSTKGQIVLPAGLRRRYGIETGDELEVIEWAGSIRLVPVAGGDPLDALTGLGSGVPGFSSTDLLAERRRDRDDADDGGLR
ncbi:MAG: hypothetical protein Kow0067_18030 [Coriobacteriia bacterium]